MTGQLLKWRSHTALVNCNLANGHFAHWGSQAALVNCNVTTGQLQCGHPLTAYACSTAYLPRCWSDTSTTCAAYSKHSQPTLGRCMCLLTAVGNCQQDALKLCSLHPPQHWPLSEMSHGISLKKYLTDISCPLLPPGSSKPACCCRSTLPASPIAAMTA